MLFNYLLIIASIAVSNAAPIARNLQKHDVPSSTPQLVHLTRRSDDVETVKEKAPEPVNLTKQEEPLKEDETSVPVHLTKRSDDAETVKEETPELVHSTKREEPSSEETPEPVHLSKQEEPLKEDPVHLTKRSEKIKDSNDKKETKEIPKKMNESEFTIEYKKHYNCIAARCKIEAIKASWEEYNGPNGYDEYVKMLNGL